MSRVHLRRPAPMPRAAAERRHGAGLPAALFLGLAALILAACLIPWEHVL